MRDVGKIAEGLFEKIRDRFEDVSLGDAEANAITDPTKARFFNFDYTIDGKNYGNITISLVDELSLKIYFSKNITQDLDALEKQKWYGFLKELREFSKRNMLSFEPRDITRPTLKHRDIKQVSKSDDTFDKDDVVAEGRMYGTNRTSYENGNNVRIMVRHSDVIDPERRGARSRKIKSIFLETANGERFKLPMNNLSYARAMARHLAEGGEMHDSFGKHIGNIAEECSKLRPFRAAMTRRVFEDAETQQMVEAAFEYHGQLKNTLSKMAGPKGYKQCKEEYTGDDEYISEEDMDLTSLKERFVKRVFNDRMEDALPIVQKAYNMKKENRYAKQFESWATNVVEGTWALPDDEESIAELVELFAEEIPLGIDAVNVTSALSNLIGDDTLFDLLGSAAEADPDADARPIVLDWLRDNMPEVAEQLAPAETDYNSNSEFELGGEIDESQADDIGTYSDSADDDYDDEDDFDDDEEYEARSKGWKKVDPKLGQGTSYVGQISGNIDIEAIFGPPSSTGGSDGKATKEWVIKLLNLGHGNTIATIYDSKGSKWHVGGHHGPGAGRIVRELENIISEQQKWIRESNTVYDPITKKKVPVKRATVKMGGTVTKTDPVTGQQKPIDDEDDDRLSARLRKKGYGDKEQSHMGKLDASQVSEDSSKPFGLRYKMFAGRDERIVTKERWFATEEQRERFATKIQDDGKFYEIDSYGSLNEDNFDGTDDSVNSIVSAITQRIIARHSELLIQLGPEAVMELIQAQAEYAAAGDQEIGSSDISGWVNNIYRRAGMEQLTNEDNTRLDPEMMRNRNLPTDRQKHDMASKIDDKKWARHRDNDKKEQERNDSKKDVALTESITSLLKLAGVK